MCNVHYDAMLFIFKTNDILRQRRRPFFTFIGMYLIFVKKKNIKNVLTNYRLS